MSLTQSPSYFLVSKDFSIDGSLNQESLNYIKDTNKSVLYLCTDTSNDLGSPEGFSSIIEAFHYQSSFHEVFDPSALAALNEEDRVRAILTSYRKMELFLKSAVKPICIVCKSNARASAVYTAYNAVNHKLSFEEATAGAEAQKLNYLSKPPLVDWVRTVVTYIVTRPALAPTLIFHQLFETESSTYTYLLADTESKEAILIDPVLETVERDAKLIRDLGLDLKYVLNTHVHADHVTGSGALKSIFPVKSVLSAASGGLADVLLHDFEPVFFGRRHVYAMSTPGHTLGCMTYVLDDQLSAFTGDALLIGGCGRTDFQGGSAESLYKSVHSRIFTLPDESKVFPAHDYKGQTSSTVLKERTENPRLTLPMPEFVTLMANLNLPYPLKIDASLPRNLKCGFD